jgi:hypothetical protein
MAETEPRVLDNRKTDYERSDVKLAAIAIIALIIFTFLVIAPLVLRGAFLPAVSDVDRKLTINPPAPQLQTDPQEDLRKFRAEEEARLHSYGWIDRSKGIVHIPIDQAMKEVTQKGIDGFPRSSR